MASSLTSLALSRDLTDVANLPVLATALKEDLQGATQLVAAQRLLEWRHLHAELLNSHYRLANDLSQMRELAVIVGSHFHGWAARNADDSIITPLQFKAEGYPSADVFYLESNIAFRLWGQIDVLRDPTSERGVRELVYKNIETALEFASQKYYEIHPLAPEADGQVNPDSPFELALSAFRKVIQDVQPRDFARIENLLKMNALNEAIGDAFHLHDLEDPAFTAESFRLRTSQVFTMGQTIPMRPIDALAARVAPGEDQAPPVPRG